MLIARQKEISILKEAYKSNESRFIAVYGRRRVGKTYLVREVLEDEFVFQHTGYYGGKTADELFEFAASIRAYGLENAGLPKNWLEAFELLKELVRNSKNRRKVIFLDELSWMDTPRSDFIMALEGFWNGFASARKDVLLIMCGSVTSWMINKVIHNKGGLYNRLSAKLHLMPFSLRECEEYLKANHIIMNRYQILQCYMIMGGVPYYWSFLRKELSLQQNIDELFFKKNAEFRNEFEYIYSALFRNPTVYVHIIKALAKKKSGMSREELLEAVKIRDSGNFSAKLEELENCGFIRKYGEYGKSKKNSMYQLIDNFTLFYLKFMDKPPTDQHFWSNQTNSPAVNSWSGLAFERVCLLHTDQIKEKLGISGILTEEYSWMCRQDNEKGLAGSQIDLLIVRKDQVIDICEMKFAQREYAIDKKTDENIRNKIEDFKLKTNTKCAIHPILVTTYGLKDNMYSGNIQNVITVEDLFR